MGMEGFGERLPCGCLVRLLGDRMYMPLGDHIMIALPSRGLMNNWMTHSSRTNFAFGSSCDQFYQGLNTCKSHTSSEDLRIPQGRMHGVIRQPSTMLSSYFSHIHKRYGVRTRELYDDVRSIRPRTTRRRCRPLLYSFW